MTASTTPRLGLPLPAASDNFLIADFDGAFTKLDGMPGITPIANFAALPTNLTSAQHGSTYLQTDNGSLWMWSKPSSAAGVWKKINTVGMLATGNQPSAQSTATTTLSSGPTLVSVPFTAAGGRRILCFFSHPAISNSGNYGYSQVGIFIDGSSSAAETSIMGGTQNRNVSHRLLQDLGVLTAGSSHTIVAKMCSVSTAGGGTTSTHGTGQMYIWEV